MVRFKVKTKEKALVDQANIIKREIRNTLKKNLNDIAQDMINDFNDSLRKSIEPGTSPPQSERRSRPQWIHTPIEEGWNYSVEERTWGVHMEIRNTSEHFDAVEFGVSHIIRPKAAPYLVFDSSRLGTVVRKFAVSGQKGKGFAQAVIDKWDSVVDKKLLKA